jgi:DNA polymerase-1
MKQIVLIDGKYLAYKMHFSHLNLHTSDRKPTGLLHGFLSELLNINRRWPESRIIICWDGKGKTWRHEAFPAYKGNRTSNPEWERMGPQVDLLLPLLRKLGFWTLELDGVEADDMIGMVAKLFSRHGDSVRIYSKDRDMFQLVDKNISIWPDLKLAPLKKKDVENWLGAPFDALLEIRAMAGDPGDNLKGLPGVGLKTAVKMWREGFRVSTMKVSHVEFCGKFKQHLLRVRKEYRLARIVTSKYDEVWSEELKDELIPLLHNVAVRPERNVAKAEMHRGEVYKFLGRYELNEMLSSRHKLFQLP